MIGIVVVVLFLLGLPLALLDLVDEHLGAGSVLSFFRLVARGHVTVSGFALRPTPRIAAAELSDAAGTRLAGCGAVVVEATLLAALRSLAAHALAGLLLWRRGGAGSASSSSPPPAALSVSVGDVFVDWTHGEDGCLRLVSLLKSVGAVRDEAARGSAPQPELSATLPPAASRPPEKGGGAGGAGGGGGGDRAASAAAAAATSAPAPLFPSAPSPLPAARRQPRGPSGLPKARGVLRTLEACAAGLEGTAAVAGISVSLSPPGRLLLPELVGRALGGHLGVEVALGARALEALSLSRRRKRESGGEGEREEGGEGAAEAGGGAGAGEGEAAAVPWWLPSSSASRRRRPARAAFPFSLDIEAARGSVAVRGWRVPTGLALESPVRVQASLGDDLARALLARVHPFLASAVSVSAAGEEGRGGAGAGAGAGARAKSAAAAPSSSPSSSASPPIPSPLLSSFSVPLPPPVRASLWPSGGHLPAESLDVVVQPLSLALAPTGPASSLVAALLSGSSLSSLSSLSRSSATGSGNGGGVNGGARLRTGTLRATVYRGGRVRAKRLDVEIAVARKGTKKKAKKAPRSRSEAGAGGDGNKAPLAPRATSAFDAAAADPLAAAQAWFSSVLSGNDARGESGGDDDGGDGDGSDSGEEQQQPAPLRLALWGSADAGANDALDARVGIPVGSLRGGGGGGGGAKKRRTKKKSKEEKKNKSGGGGGEVASESPSSEEEGEEEEDEDVVALRIVGPASNPAIDWASAARELSAAAAAAAGERVRAAAAAAVATAAASRLGSAVGAPSWLTDAASAALLRQRRPSSVGGGGGGGGGGERREGETTTKDASPAARSLLSPFSSSSLFSSSAVPSPSPLAAPPRDEPFDWEREGRGEGRKSRSSPLRGRRLRFGG